MKQIWNLGLEFFQIAVAILLASIGLKAFLLPNGFLDGGVTGISILISRFLPLNLSQILPIASIPFFIIGWFTVSKRILVKSIISVILLALVIHFENFESVTEDKLLTAIFGGLFLGAGIGLAIKNGTVLDGSEILGVYLNERFGISIGTIILVFNTILFAITAAVVSIEVALYSILTFLITGKVIDFVFQGFEDYVGMIIVTNKPEEMQQELLEKTGLGMTIFKGSSGYGSRGKLDDMQVIQTVLNRIDTKKVTRTIDSVDQDAFIVEFDVNNVKGGVLRKYINQKKNKTLAPNLLDNTPNN